jgi:hypothetical protein
MKIRVTVITDVTRCYLPECRRHLQTRRQDWSHESVTDSESHHDDDGVIKFFLRIRGNLGCGAGRPGGHWQVAGFTGRRKLPPATMPPVRGRSLSPGRQLLAVTVPRQVGAPSQATASAAPAARLASLRRAAAGTVTNSRIT